MGDVIKLDTSKRKRDTIDDFLLEHHDSCSIVKFEKPTKKQYNSAESIYKWAEDNGFDTSAYTQKMMSSPWVNKTVDDIDDEDEGEPIIGVGQPILLESYTYIPHDSEHYTVSKVTSDNTADTYEDADNITVNINTTNITAEECVSVEVEDGDTVVTINISKELLSELLND
jgi:hypothetical protein